MANPSANKRLFDKHTGIPDMADAFVVIIKTEWNARIVDALEAGAIGELRRLHTGKTMTLMVPGAVEIPFAIRSLWENSPTEKRPDAFIALGCVVRGDTPHFDYVCQSVTQGVLQLNLSLPVPVIFGVLTVDDDAQAEARIGGSHGHKGTEAAITAAKMIALNKSLQNP